MSMLNIPLFPPPDDRRQLAQQLAAGKPKAWQLLTSQPEADLNPLEWAQLAQVARRQQVPLPEIRTVATIEQRYGERRELALIADPTRFALAYRSNRTWYLMTSRRTNDGAVSYDQGGIMGSRTLAEVTVAALRSPLHWRKRPDCNARHRERP